MKGYEECLGSIKDFDSKQTLSEKPIEGFHQEVKHTPYMLDDSLAIDQIGRNLASLAVKRYER